MWRSEARAAAAFPASRACRHLDDLPHDGREPGGIAGLALPDDQDTPAEPLKRGPARHISRDVALKLRQPVCLIADRPPREPAARMLVPEASMDQHRQTAARQDHVRTAGQVRAMQAKPKTGPVQGLSNEDLGPSMPLADRPHYPVTSVFIHQAPP